MVSKIRRWLRELTMWLLIGTAVNLVVGYFRQPALPQNVSTTSLQTLDGGTLDLNAMSQQKPSLLHVWTTQCGVRRYIMSSVISLAADGGDVLTVTPRSGDSAVLEKRLTRKKMMLPTVNDLNGQLTRQWGIQIAPALVVIYRGEVRSVTIGWTSGWGMRLRLWLASWQTVGFPGSRCAQPGYGQASLSSPDKAQPPSGKVAPQARQAQRRRVVDIYGLFIARQLKKAARRIRRFVAQRPGNGLSGLSWLAAVLYQQ